MDAVSRNSELHGFAWRLANSGGERLMYIHDRSTPLSQEQLAALR
jgi:hypothetical protein